VFVVFVRDQLGYQRRVDLENPDRIAVKQFQLLEPYLPQGAVVVLKDGCHDYGRERLL